MFRSTLPLPNRRPRPRAPLPQPFELPKGIYLEREAFSVANDLVTPTMELRRRQLLERYTPQVEAMYGALQAKSR